MVLFFPFQFECHIPPLNFLVRSQSTVFTKGSLIITIVLIPSLKVKVTFQHSTEIFFHLHMFPQCSSAGKCPPILVCYCHESLTKLNQTLLSKSYSITMWHKFCVLLDFFLAEFFFSGRIFAWNCCICICKKWSFVSFE